MHLCEASASGHTGGVGMRVSVCTCCSLKNLCYLSFLLNE